MRFVLSTVIFIAILTVIGFSQALPITRLLEWDAPNTADIYQYEARMDGNLIGITSTTSIPITITSLGQHTFSVVSRNMWGDSDPETLTVTVSRPGKAGNIRIK